MATVSPLNPGRGSSLLGTVPEQPVRSGVYCYGPLCRSCTAVTKSIFRNGFLAPLLVLVSAGTDLQAQEKAVVSLKEFISTEVRSQGFSLPHAMKVHVFAKGGGGSSKDSWLAGGSLFAYGWILNAATREVVWQMGGANTRREGRYAVSDQYLDLPKGDYEAYFSNHGYQGSAFFSSWSVNIDRRNLLREERRSQEGRNFFQRMFRADSPAQIRNWREQAANYGLEIYLPRQTAGEVQHFTAPLKWKNVLVALTQTSDNCSLRQGFRVLKPATLHVYALGEGNRDEAMYDYGWIIDARTRKRVWEMEPGKTQYAGGAQKNRRTVDKVTLPAGDYLAYYVTDGSHSPSDWNAAPPCDPLLYGLTLSVPSDAELHNIVLADIKESGTVIAELVRVRNDQSLSATFTLKNAQKVRIYALGEGDRDGLVDYGWIEDAKTGTRVWSMEKETLHHAGGAYKNRLADEVITLPKGTYTLRFRTDDSHAYGRWNADPPRDQERYGITVFSLD
jgi:hypothetical protein